MREERKVVKRVRPPGSGEPEDSDTVRTLVVDIRGTQMLLTLTVPRGREMDLDDHERMARETAAEAGCRVLGRLDGARELLAFESRSFGGVS